MVHYCLKEIVDRCHKGSPMFKLLRIPSQIHTLIAELEMFFSLHQWVHFQTMLLSLLVTPFRATVSGRVRVLATGTHRTKHNEFLQKYDILLTKALQFYALKLVSLLRVPREALYVIIDDTKAAKRGKHLQAAFWYFDHLTQRYLWGHQFVCVCLVYRELIIPYAIELYHSKSDCQARGIPFRKLTSIAEDLLQNMPDFGIAKVYVLADTYYASKRLIHRARQQGFHYVSFLKSNRRIILNGRSTVIRRYIRRHVTKARKRTVCVSGVRYRTIRQSGYLSGIGTVTVIFSQKHGHRGILPVFSTDTTLSTMDIVSMYRERWSIEVLFKEAKQYLGLTAYHHRDEGAVRSHLQLVLCAHALLTHLFLTEQRAQGKRYTKKVLSSFSIRESQQHIRSIVTIDTLDYINNQSPHNDLHVLDQIKSYLLAA